MPATPSRPLVCSLTHRSTAGSSAIQYRADQIQYQRTRRAYMQNRDTIVQQIRLDMRNLELWQRTFEINREQILSAATTLESAEEDVRVPVDAQSSATLALLQALTSVLSARNALISDMGQLRDRPA